MPVDWASREGAIEQEDIQVETGSTDNPQLWGHHTQFPVAIAKTTQLWKAKSDRGMKLKIYDRMLDARTSVKHSSCLGGRLYSYKVAARRYSVTSTLTWLTQ